MDFQIVLPGKTIAGKGALSRAGLEKYGKKPLIVTGNIPRIRRRRLSF